jgi:RNA ligase (TIGR02306 family)
MAQQKVIKAHAQCFPHPNAERLELLKVGPFQLVVQKGLYQSGDTVIVAPEKALLPPMLAQNYSNSDTGISYLRGAQQNRVGVIRLRGEISQGVVIPNAGYEDLPFDEDLAPALGIEFWEPPIPIEMMGQTVALENGGGFRHHDVEQFGIYQQEFFLGEEVILTEKLHGTQGIYYRHPDGTWFVGSKGLVKRQIALKESLENSYWQAAASSQLFQLAASVYPSGELQFFGEVIPVQKGFSYGQRQVTLRLFKVVVAGQILGFDQVPEPLRAIWVPTLYRGPFDPAAIVPLKEGQETLSGKSLHIKEGAVLAPILPRRNSDGAELLLKLISQKYAKQETGEELS